LGQLCNVLQTTNRIGSLSAQLLIERLIPPANNSQLGISGSSVGTLVKVGSGLLTSVSVTTPSTGTVAGLIYDSATVANSTSSNIMVLIPSSGFQTFNFPFANGLVVQPSSISTQVVSVSYFSTS